MARLMTASPRWPSPSEARSGPVRASAASGVKRIDRRWRPGHEGCFGQAGPLRDLYQGLYRARARQEFSSLGEVKFVLAARDNGHFRNAGSTSQAPQPISSRPEARLSQGPLLASFSMSTKAARKAIQARFITPRTKSSAIG